MFDNWRYRRARRRLKRSIDEAEQEIQAQALKLKDERPEDVGLFGLNVSQYKTRKHDCEMELEVLEASHLLDKAEWWRAEGSAHQEIYDPNYTGMKPRPYFSPQNKEVMWKLISDARRNRIKEWIDIISPVASVVISLLAFALAALALYLQLTRRI